MHKGRHKKEYYQGKLPEKKRGTALKAQAGTLQINANCLIILHAMYVHQLLAL